MGPFELMDLIGNDVNLAVTKSVWDAYFHDPRFTPSVLQQELVAAGFLGRKSGRGFYVYEQMRRCRRRRPKHPSRGPRGFASLATWHDDGRPARSRWRRRGRRRDMAADPRSPRGAIWSWTVRSSFR